MLWASLTPPLPRSLRAGAHAHLPPPPQQAGGQHQRGDRDPGEAQQALSPVPREVAWHMPAGMAFLSRTAPVPRAPSLPGTAPELDFPHRCGDGPAAVSSALGLGEGSPGSCRRISALGLPPSWGGREERLGRGPLGLSRERPGCWRGQPCPMGALGQCRLRGVALTLLSIKASASSSCGECIASAPAGLGEARALLCSPCATRPAPGPRTPPGSASQNQP